MRGIPIPDREEDFTADPVELFFDLIFVFAFSRLVYHLVHHPTWAGFGDFALLFAIIWFAWSQFTWSANAMAGNSRLARVLFLISTVASIPMAAAVTTATGDGAPVFAISIGIILVIAFTATILSVIGVENVGRSAIEYSIPTFIAVGVLVAGGFIGSDARRVAWVLALAIILIGTTRAGSSEWVIRPGHFAERHGLIVIIALGEVIVATGGPVVNALEDGAGLPKATLIGLIAAGVFAALLWWSFFDRPLPALEHLHGQTTDPIEKGRFARDVYTYAHFAIVGGVILAAAGVEEILLHPTSEVPTAFRLMLFGGLALFLLGVSLAVLRGFSVIAIERVVLVLVCAALILPDLGLDGLWLLGILDLVILATLAVEHWRVEYADKPIRISRRGALR